MYKKTKYYKPSISRLGKLAMFMLLHPGAKITEENKAIFTKNEGEILAIWKDLFPATRPRIWWILHHADILEAMLKDCIYGVIHSYPSPAVEKQALIRIGCLDPDELNHRQVEFDFGKFYQEYSKLNEPVGK